MYLLSMNSTFVLVHAIQSDIFYLVCDDGYYGNCTSKCHCRNGIVCDKPTGICQDNQCDQGWMGSTCSNGNTYSSFLQFFYKLVVR